MAISKARRLKSSKSIAGRRRRSCNRRRRESVSWMASRRVRSSASAFAGRCSTRPERPSPKCTRRESGFDPKDLRIFGPVRDRPSAGVCSFSISQPDPPRSRQACRLGVVSSASMSHLPSTRRAPKRSSEIPLTRAARYFRPATLLPSVLRLPSEYPGSESCLRWMGNSDTCPDRSWAESALP